MSRINAAILSALMSLFGLWGATGQQAPSLQSFESLFDASVAGQDEDAAAAIETALQNGEDLKVPLTRIGMLNGHKDAVYALHDIWSKQREDGETVPDLAKLGAQQIFDAMKMKKKIFNKARKISDYSAGWYGEQSKVDLSNEERASLFADKAKKCADRYGELKGECEAVTDEVERAKLEKRLEKWRHGWEWYDREAKWLAENPEASAADKYGRWGKTWGERGKTFTELVDRAKADKKLAKQNLKAVEAGGDGLYEDDYQLRYNLVRDFGAVQNLGKTLNWSGEKPTPPLQQELSSTGAQGTSSNEGAGSTVTQPVQSYTQPAQPCSQPVQNYTQPVQTCI